MRGLRCRLVAVATCCVLGTSPALAAECNGDECQGPAPAPEEVIPGTAVVNGPANPPVRFPAAKGGKGKAHGKKPQRRRGKKHRGAKR